MLIQEDLTLGQKLKILSDAAKYDVACTSSGADREGQAGTMGNAAACGICHAFSADGRCVSLLKILLTNSCIYDCRYCINRVSNDTLRTAFTPEEICTLTMEFYRRNYIEGLFLSSGILNSPNETMDRIYQALRLLREKQHFRGYIHVKAIPGADPELIRKVGHLADRMSINLELPTGEGLRTLAPAKSRAKILAPMRQIQLGILDSRLAAAEKRKEKKTAALPGDAAGRAETPDLFSSADNTDSSPGESSPFLPDGREVRSSSIDDSGAMILPTDIGSYEKNSRFVPAGQSTQMIVGATPETDHQILSVTEALYRNYHLKRVFFSAYTALNEDSHLPAVGTPPPLLREHRLYQADWLLRYYGFTASELLTESDPFFSLEMDPKCGWALRHLDHFPVEVALADYETLLRVPGIGVKSARRILRARRYGRLDYEALRKFGVVLKRAGYFILCEGKPLAPIHLEPGYLTRQLAAGSRSDNARAAGEGSGFRQMSLFRDFHLSSPD